MLNFLLTYYATQLTLWCCCFFSLDRFTVILKILSCFLTIVSLFLLPQPAQRRSARGTAIQNYKIRLRLVRLDLLDLVPWRCSWKCTQRQLCYRSSPVVSVLSKMNGVVYGQAHVSTVTPDYIEPSLLWSSTSSPTLHITFQCQLLDNDLGSFCSHGQSIEVVVAESGCRYLGSASTYQKSPRF